MIESARFVNVDGAECIFNDESVPFAEFTTEVDVRFTERVRAQQHGIYGANTYLGKRLFHVTGDIMTDSSTEYWQKRIELLRAVMPKSHLGHHAAGTLFLWFSGFGEEVSSECTLDSYPEIPIQSMFPTRSPYQINWKSFDPRLYGSSRTSEIKAPTGVIGREYPKTYPKEYVGTGAPSDQLVTNSGNIETYPTITVYGPVTSPILSRVLSDGTLHSVKLNGLGLVGPSENVTIDFAQRTAFKNDGTDVYNLIQNATWWALEPGDNTIRYSGSGIETPSKAAIVWKNAYMI